MSSRSLDSDVLCLDLQTSGARPPAAQIIEAGFCLYQHGQPMPAVTTRLLQLTGEEPLPRQISRVTGLTTDQLKADGISMAALWAELSVLLKDRALPCIIHYAGFETSFLRDLAGEESDCLDIYCTFEMARRLIPDLPSRSLRALSGYLGHPIEQARRSAEHVEATAHIWSRLCAMLDEQCGIRDFDELRRWLRDSVPAKSQKKIYVLTPEVRLSLPAAPGIYRFRDSRGRILYIGKAQNLRNRVNSYFRGQLSKGSRLNELTSQIASVDFDQAYNPLHACLMENDKIKEHLPPYNRALLYGERRLGFMTRDFASCEGADPAVCYGPFSAQAYVVQLASVMALLNDPTSPLPDYLAGESIEADIVAKGVDLFRSMHELTFPLTPAGWRALLVRFWVEDLRLQREALALAERAALQETSLEGDTLTSDKLDDEVEEDEEQGDEPRPWDEFRLAGHFGRMLCGLARRIHRGRVLRQLAEGRFVFRYGKGPWQILDMNEATAAFSIAKKRPVSGSKISLQKFPSGSARFKHIDVLAYDRLTIFCAQMRGMLLACSDITWYRHSGAAWRKEDIAAHLFPTTVLATTLDHEQKLPILTSDGLD